MFILFQCRQPSTFYREIDHLFIVIQQSKVFVFCFCFFVFMETTIYQYRRFDCLYLILFILKIVMEFLSN